MNTPRTGLDFRRRGVLAAALAVAVSGPGGRALAQLQTSANAVAPGSMRSPINVTAVKGVGATASEAQAGGNAAGAGATVDPTAANGVPYNDQVMIGPQGGTVQALSPVQTILAGTHVRTAYPNTGDGAQTAGRGLLYTVNVVNDKVAAAKAAANGQFMFPAAVSNATSGVTTASSRGNETVTVDPANKAAVDAFGVAQASVTVANPNMKGGPPGFAISFVKDPITFQLTDPSSSGSVLLDLGGPAGTFTLSASGPGAVAGATVEFGTNGNILASFDVVVTPSMMQRSDVEVDVPILDPSLGCASTAAFAASFLSNFSFTNDGTTATLTGADVPLYTVNLAPNSPAVTVALDIGGFASVPEPSSVALLLLGLAAVAGLSRLRRAAGLRDA